MVAPVYNIAHILPWRSVGGVERATLRIAQGIEGRQFRSVAFHLGEDTPVREMFAAAGFTTVPYTASEPSYRHAKGFLRASLSLAREFRRREIDLVHCSDLLAGYYAGLAGRLAGRPVLCHVRGRFSTISRRDRSFLRAINKFVFVSQDAWDHFGCRVPARRGCVVYDGIEADEADGADAKTSVRLEFNIPETVKIVGMVARVAPAKDYATLARAAAKVIAASSQVRFLIIGDHSRTPAYREHYAEVKRMLSQWNVAPYFIFTDHREDVARLVSALDVFVLSTHMEGLPLVILEAMAQAKPVVATAVGGIPEIVLDGQTGLLYPHGNDALLAAHILSLLEHDGRAGALGGAGREFVRVNFTTEKFTTNMVNLYRSMISPGATDRGAMSAPLSMGAGQKRS